MKPSEEASDSVKNTEYREVKTLKQDVSFGSLGGGGGEGAKNLYILRITLSKFSQGVF